MSVAHPKRSFGKYAKIIDSPAYDASEEDNDPLTDENSNSNSTSAPVPRPNTNATTTTSAAPGGPSRQTKAPTAGSGGAPQKPRHHLAQHIALASDSDGVDSPTYDGDIESSTTYGADTPSRPAAAQLSPSPSPSPEPELGHGQEQELEPPTTPVVLAPNPLPALSPGVIATANGTSTNMNVSVVQPTPVSTASTPEAHPPRQTHPYSHLPVFISPPPPQRSASTPIEPAVALASLEAFNPAALTPEDIQAFITRAIDGEPGRSYTINAPPTDRPVRVYADGVYDLFHFGHALQLRQAKLSFPSVYLLVGVNSDEQVWSHKARTVMSHAERLESPRHCRWVDEVVSEAPWIIDQAFLDKYSIDYVAHDEDMYASAGCEDVYGYAKSLGKFIPTRRTPGVSTSSLLERIVSGYRNRDFDEKLVKMGHRELCAEGSDYDAQSRVGSRGGSRGGSVAVSRSGSPVEEGKGADRLSPTTAATQTQTLE